MNTREIILAVFCAAAFVRPIAAENAPLPAAAIPPARALTPEKSPLAIKALNLAGAGFAIVSNANGGELQFEVTNTGSQPVTITHLSTGVRYAAMKLPSEVALRPGEHAMLSIDAFLGGTKGPVMIPITLIYANADKSPGTASTNLTAAVGDSILTSASSGMMFWSDPKDHAEKSVKIIYLPAGMKIAGVAVSSGFTARLEGDTVYVKPDDPSVRKMGTVDFILDKPADASTGSANNRISGFRLFTAGNRMMAMIPPAAAGASHPSLQNLRPSNSTGTQQLPK